MRKGFSPAFTLVELLTVITIIGILAAILMGGLSIAIDAAKKAKARVEMSALVTAIQGYDAAYARYPVSPAVLQMATDAKSDFTYGGSLLAKYAAVLGPGNYTNNNSEVIAILMDLATYPDGTPTVNTNHVRNPQQTMFLNAHRSDDTSSPGVGTDYVYRDPWGNPYVITLDLDYDEMCEDAFYPIFPRLTLQAEVIYLQ